MNPTPAGDRIEAIKQLLLRLPSAQPHQDLIERWDGRGAVHVYTNHVGRSADLQVARRIARELSERGDYTVSLGGVMEFGLSKSDGAVFMHRLAEASIPFREDHPE